MTSVSRCKKKKDPLKVVAPLLGLGSWTRHKGESQLIMVVCPCFLTVNATGSGVSSSCHHDELGLWIVSNGALYFLKWLLSDILSQQPDK